MLPIIDMPIIHYVVEECVNSGIKDIIIVTRYGNHAVEDYFDSLFELEEFLKKTGKLDRIAKIQDLLNKADFAFVRQGRDLPYGNGSPLLAAKDFIGDEPFMLMWGDDLVLSEVPAVKQVKDAFEQNECDGALSVLEIKKLADKVACPVYLKEGTTNSIREIVEKQEFDAITTNLVEFGRFALTPKIFDYLKPGNVGKNNELWMTDAINAMCIDNNVIAQPIKGTWYTTGDPLRYLKATFGFALQRDDLRDELIEFLKDKIQK